MKKKFLFVGEKRSALAVRRRVTWQDGKLAAKQLFDALLACKINPAQQRFCNLFQRPQHQVLVENRNHEEWRNMVGYLRVQACDYVIVGMGRKVQRELTRLGIEHVELVHPASRGTIRKKENYITHVRQQLLWQQASLQKSRVHS